MAYTSPPKDDRPSGPSLYFSPSSSNRSYDRSSSRFSPSASNASYFADQAIRSRYRVPVDSREGEFQRYPNELRDRESYQVEREIESRIRAEILAEQMERRRILEQEIRLELMLEREMTMRRWESSRMHLDSPSEIPQFVHEPPSRDRLDVPSDIRPFVHEPRMRLDATSEIRPNVHELSRMHFDPLPEIRQSEHVPSRMPAISEISRSVHEPSRMHAHSETRQTLHEPSRMHSPSETRLSVHDHLRIPQPSGHFEERRLPLVLNHPVLGVGILGSSLNQHQRMPPATSNLVLREIKPCQEIKKGRTLLAKREVNNSDQNRKRKASTLGTDHAHRASNLQKKPKGGWSCELCKITTTSEKTLNGHFQGKKHKLMMEERLAPQNTVFHPNFDLKKFTLNTENPGPSHPNAKKAPKETGKLSETSRAEATMEDKKQKSKTNGSLKIQEQVRATKPGNVGSIKKFKFWCEMCQVGVTSEVVLAAHEKGRKHLENLEKKQMKH